MRKKVFIILGICIIAYFIKVDKSDEIFGEDGTILTNEFVGTYICELGDFMYCYVAVQPDENIFCYYNGYANVRVDGKFERCAQGVYLVTGDGLETQTIVVEGREFSLYTDDKKLDFVKMSQIPTFFQLV